MSAAADAGRPYRPRRRARASRSDWRGISSANGSVPESLLRVATRDQCRGTFCGTLMPRLLRNINDLGGRSPAVSR
jgi:hypothetical protein